MKSVPVFFYIALAFLTDQASKACFFRLVPPEEKTGLWFFIQPVSNYGAVFGLFPQWASFILVLGIVFMVLFLYMVRRTKVKVLSLFQIGLGLQIGGALGNISDRIRFGYVRDFIDLHIWPVFNLADVSILTGCILLFLSLKKEI